MTVHCANMPLHDWTRVDGTIFQTFHARWLSMMAGDQPSSDRSLLTA